MTFSKISIPMALGGVLLGGGIIIWFARRQSRYRRELAARNERALQAGEAPELTAGKQGLFGSHGILLTAVIAVGSIMIGAFFGISAWSLANGLFDKSTAEYRPVEIVEFWTTTHNYIFREYEIEYRFKGEENTHKLMSTPAKMARFRIRAGRAEIHAGRLGLPWIKDIKPALSFDE
jgi:hypothetical protein